MAILAKKRLEGVEAFLFALHPKVFDVVDGFLNIPRLLDKVYLGRFFKKKYESCLDIGAGKGSMTKFLLKHTKKLTCFDKDAEKLEVLKGRVKADRKRVSFVTGNATSLPFEDSSFDLIFSNCVLEHIKNDEKVLAEIARCLKRGGSLIMTFPNSEMRAGWFKSLLFKKTWFRFLADSAIKKYFSFDKIQGAERWYAIYRWQHIRRGYTLKEIKKRLTRHNLKVEEDVYYPSKTLTELWEIITCSRLNVLFPYIMIPFVPILYLLPKTGGSKKDSLEFGVLAKKEK